MRSTGTSPTRSSGLDLPAVREAARGGRPRLRSRPSRPRPRGRASRAADASGGGAAEQVRLHRSARRRDGARATPASSAGGRSPGRRGWARTTSSWRARSPRSRSCSSTRRRCWLSAGSSSNGAARAIREEEARAARAASELGLRPVEVLAVVPFPGARSRHLHVFEKIAPTPGAGSRAARASPLGARSAADGTRTGPRPVLPRTLSPGASSRPQFAARAPRPSPYVASVSA